MLSKTAIICAISKALDEWAEDPRNQCVGCNTLGYDPICVSYDNGNDRWVVNGSESNGDGWLVLRSWSWPKEDEHDFDPKKALLCPKCRVAKGLVPKS